MNSPFVAAASTLGAPGESLLDVIATLAASDVGVVELRAAPDALLHVGLTAAERESVRIQLADNGIDVLAVASSVRFGADGQDDEIIDAMRQHVRLARDLGARFVRVFPGIRTHPSPRDRVPATVGDRAVGEQRAARRLAAVAAESAALGVHLAIETHDSNPRGEDIVRLIDLMGDAAEGIAVIWDLLHPWRVGEPLERTWQALGARLAAGLGYVQIKDVRSRTDLTPVLQGDGIVPLRQFLRVLRDGGYAGPVSLEWERTWHPQIEPLSEALPAAVAALEAPQL